MLTHDAFDVSDDVLAQFTDEAGVAVDVVPSGDAGTALNQAILSQDAPQGDLLFGVDNTFLSRALDEDLFVPYSSPWLEDVPDELVRDPQHRTTPVDVGDVCLTTIGRGSTMPASRCPPTSPTWPARSTRACWR